MVDLDDVKKEIDFLNNKVVELSKKIEYDEKLLESHYVLFENIYLYHDLVPKGIWNQIQLLTQELLSFIDNICNENGLDYWLVYGTLLGAVRHQGFIPWDDDVDIGMMRKDYEKVYILLQQAVEKYGLSEDISVRVYHQNVKNIVMAIIQVSYRVPNNGSTMAYIDIFPFDFRETADNLNEVIYEKEVRDFYIKMVNGEDKNQVVKDYMDNLNLSYDESDYIVPATVALRNYGGLMQYIIKKDVIFPTKRIQFKDRFYKCPNNCDAYLKGVFGDYLKLPKTVVNHGLLNRIKVLDNIENHYDDAIIKLRKVNEKLLE